MFPSPLIVAPMAGGPSTPELVAAAGRAGALGFLAAGYRSAENLAGQLQQLKKLNDGRAEFGVNLFAPNQQPVDLDALRKYRERLLPEAERYGVDIPELRLYPDDDDWHAKIDLLITSPVPYVSFTFGLPQPTTIAGLHTAGTLTIATVTDAAEAGAAVDAGIDALIVQHSAAGGHSGAFLNPGGQADSRAGLPGPNLPELVARISAEYRLPVIAAGGIAGTDDVAAALHAGSIAAQAGTVFLLAEEAGTQPMHREALQQAIAGERFQGTARTRAFSGRWARGLENRFMRDNAQAPAGYPHIHYLTAPIRAAAAAAGDPEAMSLWAGEGFRSTRRAPIADILAQLGLRL
ncbi:nitronate monooxygenase [Acaricomes phytoseiuli]|uniref:nitronate monooxygenase n=1 Tax=Acaricomes phytoseiuli TaxID=291968 RepID=UPI0003A75F38|nr:nitronate monooxygenase [Acaricomes phytoseiuli]